MRRAQQEKEAALQKLEARLKETELALKELEEAHFLKATNWQKELAVQKQQLEFAELQLREAGAQLAETRRAHERATAALQDKESEQAAGEHEA